MPKKPSEKGASSGEKLRKEYVAALTNAVLACCEELELEEPIAAVAIAYDEGNDPTAPFLGVIDAGELSKQARKFKDPLDSWNPAEWANYDDDPLLLEDETFNKIQQKIAATPDAQQMRPILASVCLALRQRLPQVCEVDEHFVVYPTDLVQANLREDMVAANPPETLAALKKKEALVSTERW